MAERPVLVIKGLRSNLAVSSALPSSFLKQILPNLKTYFLHNSMFNWAKEDIEGGKRSHKPVRGLLRLQRSVRE